MNSQKCRELSRLPKAQGLASLKFRCATPGSAQPLVTPYGGYKIARAVDPSHVAAQSFNKKEVLRHHCPPLFSLSVAPKQALQLPDTPHATPPFLSHSEDANSMSIQFMTPPVIGSRAVQRNRAKNRLKEAISLVVTRGAYVDSKENVAFHPHEAGYGRWVHRDWTYVLRWQAEVYLAPLPALVSNLRTALRALHGKIVEQERAWGLRRADVENDVTMQAARGHGKHDRRVAGQASNRSKDQRNARSSPFRVTAASESPPRPSSLARTGSNQPRTSKKSTSAGTKDANFTGEDRKEQHLSKQAFLHHRERPHREQSRHAADAPAATSSDSPSSPATHYPKARHSFPVVLLSNSDREDSGLISVERDRPSSRTWHGVSR